MITLRLKMTRVDVTALYFVFLYAVLISPHVCKAQQTAAKLTANNSHGESDGSVTLNATVTNERGDYILGLGKNNFALYDGKASQEFSFIGRRDVPMSVGILLDMSGSIRDSMNKRKLDLIKEALEVFLKTSNKANEYFLVAFNSRAQIIGGSHTAESVLAAVDKTLSSKPQGQTAFYDACLTGIEQVMRGINSKRIIFIISDGEDNSSQHTFKDVLRELKNTNVALYAVNVVSDECKDCASSLEAQRVLQSLAKVTGGTVYLPARIKDINVMAGYIAEELRNQYILSFKPAQDANDNKWHRLEIKVTLPPNNQPRIKRVVVRTREGYYGNRLSS